MVSLVSGGWVAVQRPSFSRSPAEEGVIERESHVATSSCQNRPGRAVGLEAIVGRLAVYRMHMTLSELVPVAPKHWTIEEALQTPQS
jgi:hypothetical protein